MTRSASLAAVLACVWLTAQGLALGREVQPLHPIQESPNAPVWTQRMSGCNVDLVDAADPSGVVGHIGYNAFVLAIVAHRHVPCATAKSLERREWVDGPLRRPLRWRYVKAWRSTAGSAYVGDFVGTHGAKRVEFHAVH